MPFVKMHNIKKDFDTLEVLNGVSLDVNRGEIIAIIGPSGSGKSTLLRSLINLEEIDGGYIEVEGTVIASKGEGNPQKCTDEQLVKETYRKMGMVFQNFNLFPHKTAIQNVMEALIVVRKMDKAAAKEIAKKQLAHVGLTDKENAYPAKLSGGQRQRVAIARALAMNPDIMLFDEPTSSLDPELVGEVLEVIKKLAKEDMTMLIVTHEMSFARDVADRILFMDGGTVLMACPPKEFFAADNPRIQAFLSKSF